MTSGSGVSRGRRRLDVGERSGTIGGIGGRDLQETAPNERRLGIEEKDHTSREFVAVVMGKDETEEGGIVLFAIGMEANSSNE